MMAWPGIIDTLVLHIEPLRFQIGSMDNFASRQVMGKNSKGKDYLHSREYYNEPGLNITIDSWGMKIFLQMPLFAGRENNLQLADERDLEFCFEKLGEVLSKQMIKAIPISEFKVIRIDLTKDIICNQPFSFYKQVLESLYFPRMKWSQEEGSFLFKNKSRQFIFYDKKAQMKMKGTYLEGNLMRGELKLLKGQEVSKHRIRTYGDLMADFGRLHKIFADFVSRLFVEMPLESVDDIIEEKLRLIAQKGWKNAKKPLLWSTLRGVPYNRLKDVLMETLSEGQVYNILRERQRYMPDTLALENGNGVQFFRNYNELRSKFLSVDLANAGSGDSYA